VPSLCEHANPPATGACLARRTTVGRDLRISQKVALKGRHRYLAVRYAVNHTCAWSSELVPHR